MKGGIVKGVADAVGEGVGAGGNVDSVTTTTCSRGVRRNGVAAGAGVGVGVDVPATIGRGVVAGVGLADAVGRVGGFNRSNFFHVLHE